MKINVCGIAGAGTMGIGIALAAATAGTEAVLFDSFPNAIENAMKKIIDQLNKLVEKNKISAEERDTVYSRITFSNNINSLQNCDLIVEAIIEDLDAKIELFKKLENVIKPETILATNTSSLSISSIAGKLNNKENFLGIHFFNPANIMKLVEIIPTASTKKETIEFVIDLLKNHWKKLTVVAKDTPGFIVNRVARPYYSEALRIYEEGIANFETIDYVMKNKGGFKMGPFELMDFIGHDVNYKVTEKVWEQLFFDTRFTPSITQKRLLESGNYGRKTGKGFYDYSTEIRNEINMNDQLHEYIFNRILSLLINIAADTLYLGIASREDIDTAVTNGVNYPKGLLKWADEIGIENVYSNLKNLYDLYLEERYRPSPLLTKKKNELSNFYN